jgi:hypothetical protein
MKDPIEIISFTNFKNVHEARKANTSILTTEHSFMCRQVEEFMNTGLLYDFVCHHVDKFENTGLRHDKDENM